ncbi:unnamed protein product [Ectocarpus sp. CCAP 1310/34]|nr:unnamed protein product [Ectocarpus sp. CCAP 1310/34]
MSTADAAAAAGDETGGHAMPEGKNANTNATMEESGGGDEQQVGGVCPPTAVYVSAAEEASQERIVDDHKSKDAAAEAGRHPSATFADAKSVGDSSSSPMLTSLPPSHRIGAPLPSPSLSLPRRRNEAASPLGATASAAAAAEAAAAKLLKQHQEQRASGLMPANKRRLRIYPTGRNRNSKWVTREIAALDFLTGLKMRNEAAILAQGTSGGGGGGGGEFGTSADDESSPPLLDSGSGVGALGDRSRRGGGGWGWDMQNEKSSDDDNNNHGEAAAEVARGAYPAAESRAGATGAGGEAKEAKDIEGRSSTPTAGGVTFAGNETKNNSDDSDSDNGWLDQPLPSTGRGGASSGHVSAHRLRVATTGRGGTGTSDGIGGGGARVSGAGFRRLRGREAAHVRLPANFRHSMQVLPGHSAAVVRQWEQGLTRQDRLLEGRLFFSCSKGYPLMVSSVIHYKPQEEQAKRARQKRIDERGAEAFQIPRRDWRGFSYAHLLPASTCAPGGDSSVGSTAGGAIVAILGGGGGVESEREGTVGGGSVSGAGGIGDGGDGAGSDKMPYKAGFLDDPALKVGRHRHMTKGDRNTGPVVSSVLLFVKPRVLKDELNARFREEHPMLPPSLTLSKIRSVKRQALLGCYRAGMEVSTVALACIYFERLCLAGVVTKPNRRLAMAACLAIAYKFNEAMLEGVSKLPALWAFIDQEWQVSKKRVLEAEFGVLVQLSFDLHEDPRDIFHHFVLLLKMVESNATLYLGEEMMGLHQESLETFFREGTNEDGARTVSGATAAAAATAGVDQDSPGGGRPVSDNGAAGADAAGRPRVHTSQRSPFLETPAWLQRRPTNRTRWLAGWRAGFAQDDPGTGARKQPLHAPAPAAGDAADRWSKAGPTAKLEKLRQAGQGLGKVTRQRSQRLNKDVRSGVSSLLAHGISSTRRGQRRRRMES